MTEYRITDIKQQVKRPDRYSIYINGKYTLSLHESSLAELRLSRGMEISQSELEQFSDRAQIDKGYERALNLISYRLRSEWEVRDYLQRKDYRQAITQAIIERLYRRSYLDDVEFAKRWVENRRRLKYSSRRKLAMELRQKRLSDEVIDQVLAADEVSDVDALRQLIDKKRLMTRYPDEQKLIGYLARQGYAYQDIKATLASIAEDSEN